MSEATKALVAELREEAIDADDVYSEALWTRAADALEARAGFDFEKVARAVGIAVTDRFNNCTPRSAEYIARAAIAALDQAPEPGPDRESRTVVPDTATRLEAALAAIERVRAYAEGLNHDGAEPYLFIGKTILAALDGAPETEWEYGTAHADDPQSVDTGFTHEGAIRRVKDWNVADPERKGLVMRRPKHDWTPAPVQGESA